MSTFDTASASQAEALARAGLLLVQYLRNVYNGSAGPGRPRNYTSEQIDTAVNSFLSIANSIGYVGELPDGTAVVTDGADVQIDGDDAGTLVVTGGTVSVSLKAGYVLTGP